MGKASIKIHDAKEDRGLDLNSGMEKVLATLEQLYEETSDKFTKNHLRSIKSFLVSNISGGKLFAPNLHTDKLDAGTVEWLKVELGQNQNSPKSATVLDLSHSQCYFFLSSFLTYVALNSVRCASGNDLPVAATRVAALGYALWSFPIFQLQDVTAHPLAVSAVVACRTTAEDLGIQIDMLYSYFKSIEQMYQQVPYHSALHAADVVY